MANLKVTQHLSNTKDFANTATGILRDLIQKHNTLVDEVEKLHEIQNKDKPKPSIDIFYFAIQEMESLKREIDKGSDTDWWYKQKIDEKISYYKSCINAVNKS